MLNRRTLLAASATTLAAPLIARHGEAATPRNIVVMAKQIDDIISFDPAEAYEFSNNEVDGNVYRRLVTPDTKDSNKVAGDLAEKWDISPDGKTFTFHLVSNAKFASGNPLTAADVAFSFQRVVKLNKSPGFILTQFGFTPDNVEKLITAPDAKTLVMQLPEAQATSFVLFCLSANVGSVVDRATVLANQVNGDLGNAWLKNHSAGAGPYQLTSWQASDSVVLDANPHAAVAPRTRRVVIRHVADPAAQRLMLEKGDADIVRNLTSEQIKAVGANKAYTIVSAGQGSSMYIAMNQANEFLAKVPVHQAIKWAIDYDAIAKNITPNLWRVSQSFLPAGLPGALTDEPFHKDVAKAKALLAEAGYPNGFSIDMDFISVAPNADIAQAIQADLGAVGIKVNLVPGEQKQVITKTRARQHQLAILVWGTDYFDPNSNAQAWCENPDDSDTSKLKILAWRSHYKDPELTAMGEAAAKELDPAKRIAMYQKMQRLAQQRAPFAWILQQVSVAVLGKGVSGFAVGPLPDYTHYADIKKA